MFLVIGITSWAGTALIIRSQTLSIRERTFMDRARAYGASNVRLMSRHVFPNVLALILANATLTVAAAIFLETTLSLRGVGDKTTWSWGRVLEDAFDAGALTLGKFLWFVPPGLGVVLVVLAFTLVGQAFDEVLNPRLRAREAGTFEEVVEISHEVPLANSARHAAKTIAAKYTSWPGQLWFQGHWGFQYYIEAKGAKAIEWNGQQVRPQDIIAFPYNNTGLRLMPIENYSVIDDFKYSPSPFLSTMTLGPCAGFYASEWGPLPFMLFPPNDERYQVLVPR